MASRVLLCGNGIPLFRLGGSPYPMDSTVHLFIVNVAPNYFAVWEKAEVIGLNIQLGKD